MVAIATQYQINVYTPVGLQILSLTGGSIFSLRWVLKTNDTGVLSITLPYDYLPFFATDTQLELLRSVAGGTYYLEGNTRWFVRKIIRQLSASGELTITIEAYSAISLLNRRIVDYASGSAQSSKTATALDDMAKAVVYENLSTGATDVLRRLSTSYFTIDPNLTAAPVSAKSFARRKVLGVCQEIAQDSTTLGTYMAFDVIWTGTVYLFKTFIGGRGPNNTRSGDVPVIFNPQFGNLSDVTLTDDFTEEYNYIVAAGQGVGAARNTAVAKDDARIAASPFNRCEYNDDNRDITTASGQLQPEADATLRANRPKRIFNAKAQQTNASLYGRDYQFGSRVSVDFFADSFDSRIETVAGSMQNGAESIQIQLQNLGF